MKQRRADWFKGKICSCGSTDTLEIHHPDPEKKVSHKVWSWAKEKRDTELSKCIVLCEDCHKKKTAQHRKENGRPVSTSKSGYKGVYFEGRAGKKLYRSRPWINGSPVHVGYFATAEEAAIATDKKLLESLTGNQVYTNERLGLL